MSNSIPNSEMLVIKPIPGYKHYYVTSEGEMWSSKRGGTARVLKESNGAVLIGDSTKPQRFNMKLLTSQFFPSPPLTQAETPVSVNLSKRTLRSIFKALSMGTPIEEVAKKHRINTGTIKEIGSIVQPILDYTEGGLTG